MSDTSSSVILLPGAGGSVPGAFTTAFAGVVKLEAIKYPGWSRYVVDGYSATMLIDDLAAEIQNKVPHGPIRIVGFSIGGHFGYAVALQLQASGREIAGFCAVDTFMFSSAAPSVGWSGRAFARTVELVRKFRVDELGHFIRTRFWRALLRASENRLPALLRPFAPSRRLPWILRFDSFFEEELSMRLLLRKAAPWVASLDRVPVALNAPAILLRTRFIAHDDAAWRRRCPAIKIIELPGTHETLFEPPNFDALRQALAAATQNLSEWR